MLTGLTGLGIAEVGRVAASQERRLDGRIALITGAGRGIGRAVALAYAQEGAALALCARTGSELGETVEEARALGVEAIGVEADISRAKDVNAWVSEAVSSFGRIDILVNNASAFGPRVEIWDYPEEDFRQVLDVNVTGVFLVTRTVLLADMLQRGGHIINVSSGAGRRGGTRWGAYTASKFAIEGLTQMWANELTEHGVLVNTIAPRGTRTRARAEAFPEEDPATLRPPEYLAPAFVQLALTEKTGCAFSLDNEGHLVAPGTE